MDIDRNAISNTCVKSILKIDDVIRYELTCTCTSDDS